MATRSIHRIAALLLAGALAASCSGGAAETTTTTTPPTTIITTTTATTTSTTVATTGATDLDACIEAVMDAVAGVDLESPNVASLLDEALAAWNPDVCTTVLTPEGATRMGMTEDQMFEALEETLPPAVIEYFGNPTPAPFENKEDNL